MQSRGQSSQLEGPTAAVLEDAVVAWHAELQLLPCEHHHHYHLAPMLQHPYHLQGKGVKGLKRKALSFLNGLKCVCLLSHIPLKLVLTLMMDIMYGAKYKFISMLASNLQADP